MAALHIQIEARDKQTRFNVHHFTPTAVNVQRSEVNSNYDYVVLQQGKYEDAVHLNIFLERAEVLALFDQLAPVVANFRAVESTEDPPAEVT